VEWIVKNWKKGVFLCRKIIFEGRKIEEFPRKIVGGIF